MGSLSGKPNQVDNKPNKKTLASPVSQNANGGKVGVSPFEKSILHGLRRSFNFALCCDFRRTNTDFDRLTLLTGIKFALAYF